MIDNDSVVQAAGTLRRIANRLASLNSGRIVTPVPQLGPQTESRRTAVLEVIIGTFTRGSTSSAALTASVQRPRGHSHGPSHPKT
jgi:hypothetical protein